MGWLNWAQWHLPVLSAARSLRLRIVQAEWFKARLGNTVSPNLSNNNNGETHKEMNTINSQVVDLVNMLTALSELQLPNLNSCIKFTLQRRGEDHQQYGDLVLSGCSIKDSQYNYDLECFNK